MKHIKLISLFAVIILALSCIFILRNSKADVIKSKYFNYVEKGAKVVKTSPSTQYKLMETYPQATVTVYNAGTLDLANLWADKDGVLIKANPFTADVDSFYYFYVDCGKYDVKFSGTGITVPYTYGDIAICGSTSTGTGNVSTLGGTENFITKFTSSTSIGDSSLYNPSNIQASSSILFGWTSGLATTSLDIALGRNSSGKIEINSGISGTLRDLILHRIEPIPTATIPGLNFGPIAVDPSAPVAGDCWYNTSSNQFKCFNGSIVIILSTGNGVTSLNGLSAAVQLFAVGTLGSDFNISSSVDTHTFNLPDAGLAARGAVTILAQSFNGDKTFDDNVLISSNIVNSFIYSDSTKAVQTTAAPTNGQLLIGSTGTFPVVANITGDSNISIVNSAGGIQITCSGCSGGGGGTSINPTDTYVPYRSNATTFLDSPFFRETHNTIGLLSPTSPTSGVNILKIYGDYTNVSNNDWLQIYNAGFNFFALEASKIGTGVQKGISIRGDTIEFRVDVSDGSPDDAIVAWDINAFLGDGGLNPGASLTYDIGNNTHRVKNILAFHNPTVTTANFDKTTNTTLANVTSLTRTLESQKIYKFEAELFFDADATGGSKYAIGGTVSIPGLFGTLTYQIDTICNASNSFVINSRQTSIGGSAGQAGCTAGVTKIYGTIKAGSAGTLTVQFAQNASNGTSTILPNSTFKVEIISN